jgi:hypothetical protein
VKSLTSLCGKAVGQLWRDVANTHNHRVMGSKHLLVQALPPAG